MITDILTGKENERITAAGLDKLSTYGIMKDSTERNIKQITEKLIYMGYAQKTEDEYPVLKLNPSALDVLRGDKKVMARLPKSARAKRAPVYACDPVLLDKLKALRAKLASVQGVPAYLIFTDTSLRDMCERLPRTDSEFLNVSGVGAAKLERY